MNKLSLSTGAPVALSQRPAARRISRAVRAVEALEARALLSGTPFNYAISDAHDHVLTLSLQGGNLQLADSDQTANTVSTQTVAFDPTGSVAVTGASGHDVLQLDFSGGTPFGAGGLTFTGGGSTNQLTILNGSFSASTYQEAAGTITLAGNPLITCSNIGNVTDLSAASSLFFETGTGAEAVSVSNGVVVNGFQTTAISSPGLTLAFANKAYVQLDTHGNTSVTLNNSLADAALGTFELDTLGGADTVKVFATPAGVSTSITSDFPGTTNGHDEVTVGNGTLAGILGPVDVSDDADVEDLVIDDSADAGNRTVAYGQSPSLFFEKQVAGLSAFPVTFSTSDVNTLTVKGGTGTNTFTITDTVSGAQSFFNTGTGTNTVNVNFVRGNGPLTISGHGGQDTVKLNFTTNNPGGQNGFSSIQAPVTVTNTTGATHLVIDTTAESAAQTIGVGAGVVSVTNLVPKLTMPTTAIVNYSLGVASGSRVPTLTVNTGAAADTFNIVPDSSVAMELNASDPSSLPGDVLNVDYTGVSNTALDATATAGFDHTLTFGNRKSIAFTNFESWNPVPVTALADLALQLTGPASVNSNGTISYAFTVTNAGPSDATNVILADTLPANATFQSAGSFTTSVSGNVLSLNLGTIAASGSVSGTLVFLAGTGPVAVSNSVTVSSDVKDLQPSNNTLTVPTSVLAPPPTLSGVAVLAAINEGGTAHLIGTLSESPNSGTMTLMVTWGAGQGSDTYTFAEGTTSFDVTHFYPDNPASPATSFAVGVTLTNVGGTATASAAAVVHDLAPSAAAIVGPSTGVRGQSLSFTDLFTDAGVLDTHTAVFSWGDGTNSAGAVSESMGSGSLSGSHVFQNSGTYTVTLTVTDKDGLSATVSESVTISNVLVESDPVYGGSMLVVGGSAGSDIIDVKSFKNGVRVTLNGVVTDVASTFGRIVVYTQGGSDSVQVDKKITNDAFLYGGDGGVTLQGGGGNCLLVGGTGNDVLTGGQGRNVIIGGGGSDQLTGGSSDDLLLSGSTVYGQNDAALAAIFNEWTRVTDSYAKRISSLQSGGGLNGSYVLNASTFVNNSTGSTLTGGAGNDWFIFNSKDRIRDRASTETGTAM